MIYSLHQSRTRLISYTLYFINVPDAMAQDTIPTYMGLSGKPLGIAITVILTFGFVLVGYDQGKSRCAI